jgi:hypothetical protein
MKKNIFMGILSLLFMQCTDKSSIKTKTERGNDSVVGKVLVGDLPDFNLQRDTAQVEVDTLGYYFVKHPMEILQVNIANLKPVVENAEIFDYNYTNGGRLRETTRFCFAKLTSTGFKITFHGSPSSRFNSVLTLGFVDSFVVANYTVPFYEKGQIIYKCHIRTDSLQVTLNKYPVVKGDLLRGYLYYDGLKQCTIQEDNNRVVGEMLKYRGYFECVVE